LEEARRLDGLPAQSACQSMQLSQLPACPLPQSANGYFPLLTISHWLFLWVAPAFLPWFSLASICWACVQMFLQRCRVLEAHCFTSGSFAFGLVFEFLHVFLMVLDHAVHVIFVQLFSGIVGKFCLQRFGVVGHIVREVQVLGLGEFL